jgi:hypothetical protein
MWNRTRDFISNSLSRSAIASYELVGMAKTLGAQPQGALAPTKKDIDCIGAPQTAFLRGLFSVRLHRSNSRARANADDLMIVAVRLVGKDLPIANAVHVRSGNGRAAVALPVDEGTMNVDRVEPPGAAAHEHARLAHRILHRPSATVEAPRRKHRHRRCLSTGRGCAHAR